MNDEAALSGRSADTSTDGNCSSRLNVTCVLCHVRQATTKHRTPSYIGTWNLPEPVCGPCAAELDELRERIARGAVRVDVVVQKFRGKAAA